MLFRQDASFKNRFDYTLSDNFRIGKFRSEYMSVLNFDTRSSSRFALSPQGNLIKSLKFKLRPIERVVSFYYLLTQKSKVKYTR